MNVAVSKDVYVQVSWNRDEKPRLQWQQVPGAELDSQTSPLFDWCERALQAVRSRDFSAAAECYEQAVRTFHKLPSPTAADRFLWCCAHWGKGAAQWNVALGGGTFDEASPQARKKAWESVYRAMGEEAAAVPKPLSMVTTWADIAVRVATRSHEWPYVAALAQFLAELGGTLDSGDPQEKQVMNLFMDLIAAAWAVLLVKQPDARQVVIVARDLQARCELKGKPLPPIREFLFEGLMAARQFAQARHEADEVISWAEKRRYRNDEMLDIWRQRSQQAGAAAGDPYDLALLGQELPTGEPVDRVVGLRGRTALMGAVRTGNLELVKRLLDRGANVNFSDPQGYTPVHLAVANGSEELIRFLAERGGDVNAQARDGDTALHLVVDLPDTVRLLLELGADPSLEDGEGATALDCATQDEVVALLTLYTGSPRANQQMVQQVLQSVRSTADKVPAIRYVARAWYDCNREADVRVICGETALPLIETEDLETLIDINRQRDLKRFETTIFQWHQTRTIDGRRGMFWFDKETGRAVGNAIRGGITRRLMLLVTTFEKGALSTLADTVGPGQLDTLGLLWYFSGDDITDKPAVVDEIGAVCQTLDLEHLVILTGAYDEATDELLAKQIKKAGKLKTCRIFLKDEPQTYPSAPAPRVSAALSTVSPPSS